MNIESQAVAAGDPSCDFDPKSITADEAVRRIVDLVTPVTQIESISLRASMGRVTARDIPSRVRVPNHTNSAMDGYAVRGNDLPQNSSKDFSVTGTSFAGAPYRGEIQADQCVRIMTGAVMPEGTDTVVTQERVQRHGDKITVMAGEKPGSNVRQAGEDLEIGDIAIARGTRIGPAHLGLAASLGFSELPCYRKPRVAFFLQR